MFLFQVISMRREGDTTSGGSYLEIKSAFSDMVVARIMFEVTSRTISLPKGFGDDGSAMAIKVAIGKEAQKFAGSDCAQYVEGLAPSAQAAIYASSFLIGYDNTHKAVKKAMSETSLKASSTVEERSDFTVQAVADYANTKTSQMSRAASFVWSYYNEDLKSQDAYLAKSASSFMVAEASTEELSKSAQTALEKTISDQNIMHSYQFCIANAGGQEEGVLQKQPLAVPIKAEEKEPKLQAQLSEKRRDELLRHYDLAIAQVQEGAEKAEKAADSDKRAIEQIISSRMPLPVSEALKLVPPEQKSRKIVLKILLGRLAFMRRGRSDIAGLTTKKLAALVSSLPFLSRK
jgi:hypothetical protein